MQITPLVFSAVVSGIAIEVIWRNSSLDPEQGPWAEWLAWAVLALWCRFKAVLPSKLPANPKDAEKNEPASDSPRQLKILVLTLLPFLLVASALLWTGRPESVAWAVPLVSVTLLGASRINYRPPGVLFQPTHHNFGENMPFMAKSIISPEEGAALTLACTVSSTGFLFTRAYTESSKGFLFAPAFLVLQIVAYVLLGWHGTASLKGSNLGVSLQGPSTDLLALEVFGLWSFYVVAVAPWLQLHTTLLILGLLKSYNVYCMLALTTNGMLIPANLVQTASLVLVTSLQDIRVSFFEVFLALLCSFVALTQLEMTLPVSATRRKWIVAIIILPLLKFAGVLPFDVPLVSDRAHPSVRYSQTHPIESLHDAGLLQFNQLLTSQSKTLDEAVTTYTQRYKRKPPPDFDKWFEIAQREGYILIDEFDTIMESMEPFWGITPSTLRARVESLSDASYMIRWDIKDHKVENSTDHVDKWQAIYVNEWFSRPGYLDAIPDTTFLLSYLDEPRVVAPFDAIMSVKEVISAGGSIFGHPRQPPPSELNVEFLDVGRQNAWQALMQACPITSPARSPGLSPDPVPHLRFISSLPPSLETCQSSFYPTHHGLLSSPESMSITHTLVPILSQGKPSIFNDILYPSVWYWGQMAGHEYHEEDDSDYSLKKDNLYWTGKATGGYTRFQNWEKMHRPRVALMTAEDSQATTTLLRRNSKTQVWQEYQDTYSNLSHLFDVRITDTGNQCEAAACQAMRDALELVPFEEGAENPNRDPISASYGSKYVLDIDGNAFSGRYYRMLKSKSCVLKQTIIKEWHDGRLVPWVHFIPISLEAGELGEVMRWLVEEEQGRVVGERVAREGREWASATLRQKDLEITMVRLIMELGRVMSDDRDQLGYVS